MQLLIDDPCFMKTQIVHALMILFSVRSVEPAAAATQQPAAYC